MTHPLSAQRRSFLLATALALAVSGCERVRRPDGGEGLLAAGTPAPEFTARDQTGAVQTLSAHRGHPVVLFFYPRDGTPGCTREACAFRDVWDRFAAQGVHVLGVSTDGVEAHARFAQEHRLNFPLLADPDGSLLRLYGVTRTLGMASRVTFLLRADGVIARVWPSVDPGVHAAEVLREVAALPAAAQ